MVIPLEVNYAGATCFVARVWRRSPRRRAKLTIEVSHAVRVEPEMEEVNVSDGHIDQ